MFMEGCQVGRIVPSHALKHAHLVGLGLSSHHSVELLMVRKHMSLRARIIGSSGGQLAQKLHLRVATGGCGPVGTLGEGLGRYLAVWTCLSVQLVQETAGIEEAVCVLWHEGGPCRVVREA